ncbi:MAG: tRNA pseudouridine(55) synthase TruB [Alphaproteobacteria bacterium]|nr:tRNA pseudouridine(55) synthase TruB [Alphaproteobacteria bacterium]
MPRHKKGNKISGWLVVDKPRGMGSTQVVSFTRRLFNAQKNGHCGTLDPFATGVLPIAFGEATKLIPYVTDGEKEYEFVLYFGEETDTLDTEGQVVAISDVIPSEAEIRTVLSEFVGEIIQIPPAYSAIKIDGKRAYNLVRQGEEVQIPERKIKIYELELLEMLTNRTARLRVRCSKGTYVRTLGADIARKLGSCGYLKELRRTKCGNFDLSQKILLENIKNMEYGEALLKSLLPVMTCLRDIAVIAVGKEDAKKLKLGQGLSPKMLDVKNFIGQEAAAVFENELVAIVRIDERKISPVRVFNFD